jgi:hypothetical protein
LFEDIFSAINPKFCFGIEKSGNLQQELIEVNEEVVNKNHWRLAIYG